MQPNPGTHARRPALGRRDRSASNPKAGSQRPRGIARTSSDLAASTVISSALGLIFWALATRLFSAEKVGLGSAQISGATLAATAAQLNLGVMLNRYLPTAGKYTPWILRRVYTVVLTLSIIGGLAFLAFGLAPETGSWESTLLFVLAVPCLALFAIQDMALLSIGASRVVPIENMLFAVAKVLLLPALVAATFASGVFLAWVIPAAVVVGIVTWLLVRRFVPQHVARSTESLPLPPRDTLWRLVMWQYIAGLANQAYKSGLPLVIVAVVGLKANGHFTVPWMIFLAFSTLIQNVLLSFQYHTRRGEPVTAKVFGSVVRILGVLTGLGSLVVVVGAPLILRIVAPDFLNEAVGTLRLLGAAVPMLAVWSFYLSFVWLENKLSKLATYNLVVAAVLLGLTVVATATLGAVGAAWAVFATFSAAGLVGLVGLWHRWSQITAGLGDWTRD